MSAPIGHTCPNIDSVIGAIKRSLQAAEDGRISTEEDLSKVCFEEIINELWRQDDTLEDLRTANSALREWGEGLESIIENHETAVYDLEEKISDLERRIEEGSKFEKEGQW